jgi:hypothetical protein
MNNTDLLIWLSAAIGFFILALIGYRIGYRHGVMDANRVAHQQGFKRGYDTAWVDRQLHDAKQRELRTGRCSQGRFTSKPKIGNET